MNMHFIDRRPSANRTALSGSREPSERYSLRFHGNLNLTVSQVRSGPCRASGRTSALPRLIPHDQRQIRRLPRIPPARRCQLSQPSLQIAAEPTLHLEDTLAVLSLGAGEGRFTGESVAAIEACLDEALA